jgi:phosphoglycerate kinase
MNVKTVNDLNLKGKKTLIRVDFNVPLKDGKITDDNRIVQSLPTIQKVIKDGGKVILLSHLGKVKSEEDKLNLSLKPVSVRLAELLNQEVKFVNQTRGIELENAINSMNDSEVLLIENTRFESGETKNDSELGKYWASLGELFINDAFGTAHRAHASNVGIAANLDAAAGYLLEKEINFIGNTVNNPELPMIAILGGSKVSDKIGVIENLIDKADKILIGGGMMFTFLKAQGKEIGSSLVEDDKIDLAKSLLEKANGKIILPVDTMILDKFADEAGEAVSVNNIPSGKMGLDIGPETVDLFTKALEGAKTVIWNGPMGVFEFKNYSNGTNKLCEAIANLDDATTIIGGGDSAAAAIQLGYAEKFSHISTGGGASLEYLEGKELPGITCLTKK